MNNKENSQDALNPNRGTAATEAIMATSFLSLPSFKNAAWWSEQAAWHRRQAKECALVGNSAGLQIHRRKGADAARLAKSLTR